MLDAALGRIAAVGVARTSVGDIARAAGCSRATAYRTFPGGRDELLAALLSREVGRTIRTVSRAVAACADAEDALTEAVHGTAIAVHEHAALQFLLEHEPEAVLPVLG